MTKKQPALTEAIDDLVAHCDPAARGIVQCLRMLAEEAGSLSLPRTRNALTLAMEACAAESHGTPGAAPVGSQIVPPGTAVH